MTTLLIANSDGDPFRFSIPAEGVVRIGRDRRNDMVIPDRHISQFHAELRYDSGKDVYWLKDLDSQNGTRINGEKIAGEKSVKIGDRIVFGILEAALIVEKPVLSMGPADPTAVAGLEGTESDVTLPEPSRKPEGSEDVLEMLSKELFTRLDLIDQLIERYKAKGHRKEVVDDLSVLRTSFDILLQRFHIEPFTFEPQTVVDLPVRKRIEIVDTVKSTTKVNGSSYIAETLHAGYLCRREKGDTVILRKAQVTTFV